MAHDVRRITLNDGNAIPQLGIGVWQVPQDVTARVVSDAIRTGYRAIDTAQGYGNEEGVGEAIRWSEVPRGELFITSKLRSRAHERDKALREFDQTMAKLGIEQIDLFLIHWPVPARDKYTEAWHTLIELREEGRIRSIGVSNFDPVHLERIIGETGVTPVVNQIELHPLYQQRDKRAFHRQHQIAIESYSPLGRGGLLDNETITAIAKKHGKSPAQVMIRWQVEEGIIVIPKSNSAERIAENFDVFDFALDDDDKARIAALDDPRGGKIGSEPANNNNLF